jgi:hypothetical protein
MIYEDGVHRMFWNVGTENSDPGESPKRKYKTFTTQLKFGIKRSKFCSLRCMQIHILLTLVEGKGEWSASCPSCCTPRRTSHRYWAGDWLTIIITALQTLRKIVSSSGPLPAAEQSCEHIIGVSLKFMAFMTKGLKKISHIWFSAFRHVLCWLFGLWLARNSLGQFLLPCWQDTLHSDGPTG